MSKDFTHLVITRINCEYPNDPHYPYDMAERLANKRADSNWLRDRVEFLNKYTKPSLASQTNQDFRWLILAHKESPTWFKQELVGVVCGWNFGGVLRFTDKTPRDYLPGYIKEEVDTEWVITTTLDSDDAACHKFVGAIQSNFDHKREYLNLPRGYTYALSTGRFYGRKASSNPFISLVEETTAPKGVYCQVHGAASLYARVRQIEERVPMWVEVCHGNNLINKPRVKRKHAGRPYSDVKQHVTMKVD